MLKLVALLVVAAVASVESAPWGGVPLVRYPNGAVVPYDPANQAATAAHLAITGYGYHGHHYGKRSADADAEADAGLVAYPNGALVPYNPYLHGGLGYHYGYAGYPYYG